MLCRAVLRRAVPWWSVLCCGRSALSCHAAPCLAVVCRAVAWRAVPCCAVPCCVVLCCVVSWGSLSWCVARRWAAVWCAVLPVVVPCFAVVCVWLALFTAVPAWGAVGAGYTGALCGVEAGRGYVGGWWPGGAGRCRVAPWACVAGVRGGYSARWVGWVSARLPTLGACALVPRPLGLLASRGVPCSVGWGVMASSGALGPLWSCPSAFLPFPLLGAAAVLPSSSGACAVACLVALAVAGVAARRLGCGGGLRGVLGGSPRGCSPFSPCGCTLLPLCGVRWSMGATRCGWCAVRSVLQRRILAGVRPRRSCGVDSGWGGAGLSVVAFPSCVCALVPVVAPSPPMPRPLAFPFPGLLVVSCPRVALPPVPCPCGRLAATLGLSSPPCRGPSLCTFSSRCGGARALAEPVGP